MSGIPPEPRLITEFNGAKIRRTPDGKASVYDLLAAAGAKNPRETYKRLSAAYPDVVTLCDNVKFMRSDGKLNRASPATDEAGWRRVLTVLPGMLGGQYREAANQLVDLFLKADISVAESVVERNNSPKDLERLQVRLDGKKVRHSFTGAIARHGGSSGPKGAYVQTSIATCQGVTGHRPGDLRALRKIPKGKTRDGLTTEELVRTAYIEQVSSVAMDANNVQGDKEIIGTHTEVVKLEGALYRNLTMKRPA